MADVAPAEGYLEWAQEKLGVVVHHPLKVLSTPGKDERGVFCERYIPADTIVVSVPWEVRVRLLLCNGIKYFISPFVGGPR